MTRSIKTKTIADFTSVSLLSICNTVAAGTSTLHEMQISGSFYSYTLVSDAVQTFAQTGTVGGIMNLLSVATGNISRAFSTIDTAALTQPLQQKPAAWTAETTASIKPNAPKQAAAPSSGDAVFGTVAIPFKRLAALKKLAPALEEMNNGTAITCGAKPCLDATAAINVAYTKAAQSSIRDKLNAVNVHQPFDPLPPRYRHLQGRRLLGDADRNTVAPAGRLRRFRDPENGGAAC
jgi:hypothetical protein